MVTDTAMTSEWVVAGIMYRPRGRRGVSEEVKSFKCDYCFTVFHSDGAWDDHQSICKQLLELGLDIAQFKRSTDLDSHIKAGPLGPTKERKGSINKLNAKRQFHIVNRT